MGDTRTFEARSPIWDMRSQQHREHPPWAWHRAAAARDRHIRWSWSIPIALSSIGDSIQAVF